MGDIAAMICAISFALLMLALTIVAFKLARTMAITNNILDDIRKEAVPLMGKIQTTMDHVNNEMGYVDGVLRSVEGIAARANAMTQAAQSLLTSPLVRVLSLGAGMQRALRSRPAGKAGKAPAGRSSQG